MNRELLPIHYWRRRLKRVQLKCPKCDDWFNIPKDISINLAGELSAVIYHFCIDIDKEVGDSWVVLAQLEDWHG